MHLFYIGICLIIIGTMSFLFFYYTDNDYQIDKKGISFISSFGYIQSKLNSSNSINRKYLQRKINLTIQLNQEIEVMRDKLYLFNDQEILYNKLYKYNCNVYDYNRLANYFHLSPQIFISQINNVKVLMIPPLPVRLTGKYKKEWMNKLLE